MKQGMNEETKEFKEGYDAYNHGKASTNPYTDVSAKQADDWDMGWALAKYEDIPEDQR